MELKHFEYYFHFSIIFSVYFNIKQIFHTDIFNISSIKLILNLIHIGFWLLFLIFAVNTRSGVLLTYFERILYRSF